MKKYTTHLIVILPWLLVGCFWWRLPKTVAMHIDLFGRSGNYADTRVVIPLMGALLLAAHVILLYIIDKYPKQFGISSNKAKMYYWTMPVGSVFIMWCLVGKYFI